MKVKHFFLLFFISMLFVSNTADRDKDNKDLGMLLTINELRKRGCQCGNTYMPPASPLKWSDALGKAAKIHSNDMRNRRFFSHTGSDGSRYTARIRRYFTNFGASGENIHRGSTEWIGAYKGWRRSPGHCKNMMNPRFTHIGWAKAGDYWTQVLVQKR